ncbi:MAG TPA: STAS domain-containing protein [Rhodocyclaceae bacterium]|nr:STAS domain-containing protein [Rhodocyclaceae bacterium]
MSKQIAVSGEFTIFNAIALREKFLSALNETDSLEVDLSQVSEIDSTGVQLMLAAQREAEERQKGLYFTHLSPVVADVLALTDLSASFAPPLQSPA